MNSQLLSDPPHRVAEQSSLPNDFRIGIVGCGPRGLHCLQSLTDELRQRPPAASPVVTIFEPSPYPGAGNVYDPRQPPYLRMNFAAKYISAWPHTVHDQRLPFLDWLNRNASSRSSPHDFAPRAEVGKYLYACYQQVLAELQNFAAIHVIPARVSSVQPLAVGRWKVDAEGDQFVVDELMLTVGHEGWRTAWSQRGPSPVPMIPTFPTEQYLHPAEIPPGSRVAIRGFGLTWIDAALALTEGRGGTFEHRGQKWRYYASGEEPQRLLPCSRTGRPMLAKPDESQFVQPTELAAIWARGRSVIQSLPRPVGLRCFIDSVWDAAKNSAARALNCFSCGSHRANSAASVQAWFDRWCQKPMDAADVVATLRQSHAVATNEAAPDIAWALGAAWRNLYPALVDCISHGGLTEEAWPKFRQIAIEMERIAFGPPPANVGRILALIEAGIADLQFIRGSLHRNAHQDGSVGTISHHGKSKEIDRCVDAVLPSPLQLSSTGPIPALLNAGLIQRLPGGEGIHVDQAGRPINGRSPSRQGLAILGRVTEGCILGNDTLSRSMHDHPRRWAASVIRRLQRREAMR